MREVPCFEIPFDDEIYSDENAYYEDITNILKILFKHSYTLKLRNDGYTTIIEYDKPDFSGAELCWISDDEVILSEEEYQELCNPKSSDFDDEMQRIAASEFYSDKIEKYLNSKGIDLMNFYVDQILNTDLNLDTIDIDKLVELVDNYQEKHADKISLEKDRMIEENEQH